MLDVGITGASGFMGSYLLRHLQQRPDHRLRALTRTIHPDHTTGPRLTWLQGDLVSPRDCATFASGLDVIVHFAHVNTPLTSDAHLSTDALANMVPTLALLQAIRDGGKRPHVIFASSGGALYKLPSVQRPLKETDPCEPTTSYGIQKLAVEHYLRMAATQGWLTATVLRIGNAYGALLPVERFQGFIGVAINQLAHEQAIRIFGNPDNVRDYVHLEDVCRAVTSALNPQQSFDVYNVGTGTGYSVRDIVALLERVTGRRLRVEHATLGAEARRLPSWAILDASKAERELGWSPSVPFADGLRRMCEEALGSR